MWHPGGKGSSHLINKKSKIGNVLDRLPGMMDSVKSAADAHKKAVAKWQNLSDSD